MTNDPITDDMQAANNISWFAVDIHGRIGSFESSGFGWIHPYVLRSESKRRTLWKYFSQVAPCTPVKQHKEVFDLLYVNHDPDRYCESASFFASRGLYVYDIPLSPKRTSNFLLLVEPERPRLLSELPNAIQDLLSPITLSIDFIQSRHFHVDEEWQ